MRKSTFKMSGLLLAIAFVIFSYGSIIAQCDLNFKYKVEHTTNNSNNGKILLQMESGEAPFKIRLIDLNSTEKGFVDTKEFKSFSSSKFQVVFRNLKPGNYLVRVDNDNCKKSLTGIDGIEIK